MCNDLLLYTILKYPTTFKIEILFAETVPLNLVTHRLSILPIYLCINFITIKQWKPTLPSRIRFNVLFVPLQWHWTLAYWHQNQQALVSPMHIFFEILFQSCKGNLFLVTNYLGHRSIDFKIKSIFFPFLFFSHLYKFLCKTAKETHVAIQISTICIFSISIIQVACQLTKWQSSYFKCYFPFPLSSISLPSNRYWSEHPIRTRTGAQTFKISFWKNFGAYVNVLKNHHWFWFEVE